MRRPPKGFVRMVPDRPAPRNPTSVAVWTGNCR
jgi:hypothetical protein